MTEVEPQDDGSILDSDRLFRRVPPNQLVWIEGVPRPSTALFKHTELSVYIESVMIAQGRLPADAIFSYPTHNLVAITAGMAREFSYPIVKDCAPPNDPAHGLVIGKKTDGFARAMVRKCIWIIEPESKPLDRDQQSL